MGALVAVAIHHPHDTPNDLALFMRFPSGVPLRAILQAHIHGKLSAVIEIYPPFVIPNREGRGTDYRVELGSMYNPEIETQFSPEYPCYFVAVKGQQTDNVYAILDNPDAQRQGVLEFGILGIGPDQTSIEVTLHKVTPAEQVQIAQQAEMAKNGHDNGWGSLLKGMDFPIFSGNAVLSPGDVVETSSKGPTVSTSGTLPQNAVSQQYEGGPPLFTAETAHLYNFGPPPRKRRLGRTCLLTLLGLVILTICAVVFVLYLPEFL